MGQPPLLDVAHTGKGDLPIELPKMTPPARGRTSRRVNMPLLLHESSADSAIPALLKGYTCLIAKRAHAVPINLASPHPHRLRIAIREHASVGTRLHAAVALPTAFAPRLGAQIDHLKRQLVLRDDHP